MRPDIKFSKVTLFLGFFIIISASFTRQILNFIKIYSEEKGIVFLAGLILGVSAVLFLIFIIRENNTSFIKIFLCISFFLAGLIFTYKIKIPEEKIHILEYACLGWLAARDLCRINRRIKGVVFACIFGFSIGILDEVFQAVLPYRYFQMSDIVLNCLGAAWGGVLYLTAL